MKFILLGSLGDDFDFFLLGGKIGIADVLGKFPALCSRSVLWIPDIVIARIKPAYFFEFIANLFRRLSVKANISTFILFAVDDFHRYCVFCHSVCMLSLSIPHKFPDMSYPVTFLYPVWNYCLAMFDVENLTHKKSLEEVR